SRGDAPRRIRRRRSAPLLRPAAGILGAHRARLSDAVAGNGGRSAVSRALSQGVRITPRATSRIRNADTFALYPVHMSNRSRLIVGMIHVCSLARLHETVAETKASHVVTLL